MTQHDRDRWDARYRETRWKEWRDPHPLLVHNAGLLTSGVAIDLACGMGHNAIWLAERGYTVTGVDVSGVAIRRAQTEAWARGLSDRIKFIQADLSVYRPKPNTYDLVCVIRYLNRNLFPAIRAALKPSGLLIYASLNQRRLETRPDTDLLYLLEDGELLRAFEGMVALKAGDIGDLSYLIARQP